MAHSKRDNNARLYDIIEGEVASIQTYGVFVQIPGSRKQGLVHISQMCSTKVEDPSDICNKGDKVWCKVISIDADGGKIGLSMKVVNQGTGKDTDPNHVQASLDEQKRKSGHKRGISKIELDAVLQTTCQKCGGKGHLAQDCFHIPGGHAYELLPEDDVSSTARKQSEQMADHPPKHKKRKKEKKKHKKHDSSSESEDHSSRKHHKKKEKRKRHDSEEHRNKKRKKEKLKRKKSS